MGTWGNVLINHLLLVIPVIPVSLYKFVSSYVTKTRTHTHTHTHTHTPLAHKHTHKCTLTLTHSRTHTHTHTHTHIYTLGYSTVHTQTPHTPLCVHGLFCHSLLPTIALFSHHTHTHTHSILPPPQGCLTTDHTLVLLSYTHTPSPEVSSSTFTYSNQLFITSQ